jgi:hypothetical protein
MYRVRFDSIRVFPVLAAILFSVCMLAGCVTTAVQETARTAPQGGFEGGASLTPVYLPFSSETAGPRLTPAFESYGKVGLSSSSDLGFRLGNGGAGLNIKYRFLSDGVEVAARIGTSVGITLAGSLLGNLRPAIGWVTISPRTIVSREPASGLPWAFDVGLDYNLLTYDIGEASAGTGWLDLKAGAGLPFRVARSQRLMPEVGPTLPLVGSVPRESDTEFLPGVRDELTLGITIAAVTSRDPQD